jgi:hypothetical protein
LVLRDRKLSKRFRSAVDVFGATLRKVKASSTEERRNALLARARKLKDPAVARTIEWAVENRRAMNVA